MDCERQDADVVNTQEENACPICQRNTTKWSSLREVIDKSRQWLEGHPSAPWDYPGSNNLKQMLTEACDFAATMLECAIYGRTAPAYANFRCLLERAHLAMHFVSRNNVGWEYQSMARRQESLSRLVGNIPLGERGWPKEHLSGIAYWNRSPDDEKPATMRKHTQYDSDIGKMPSPMREWYEASSMYVHPTFMGEQNIGRILQKNEVDALVSAGHMYLCFISLAACQFELAMKNANPESAQSTDT